MSDDIVILVAESDMGQAGLIQNTLKRKGISNDIIHFHDGEEVLNFFRQQGGGPCRQSGIPYILLLDLSITKVDGIDVLREIKRDEGLKDVPVIVFGVSDDPWEIDRCHAIGCSLYIEKPADFEQFAETIRQFGEFLNVAMQN